MSTLERYLYFIVMKENMVDKFIKHLEISSFMDFLLKIISTDKPKQPTYVILLLKQQRLIEKLLDCLDSSNVSTVQNTATDFLKALITLSANSNNEIASAIGPNELTRRLVSPGMISKIGLLMAQGGLPLSNCVGIIIEIIRKNHSDYDLVQVMQTTVESHPPDIRDPIYLGDMIQYFARNLPELCAMMKKSLPKNFKTPFGIIEPLGMDRFKVCELVAELLHCSNMALLNEPEGQLIVKERDPIRRVKVAELLKEHFLMESNDFDEDDEGQFDMRDTITIPEKIANNKTNGTSDKKANNSDTNNQLPNNDNNNNNEEEEEEEEDNLSLQVEKIRKNPVIGDRLKLALKDNNVVDAVLEMLFDFPWNNFLHNVVFDIVQQILNGSLQDGVNRFLIADLFLESRITELIIAGDQYCQQYEETNKLRLGYMGHLTLIAEEVAKFVSYLEEMNIHMLIPDIEEMLSEKAWVEYSNAVLNEARDRYNSTFDLEDEDEEDDVDDEERIDLDD
ncbi:SIT4 phosphatase-associated protein, partial [Hanseniaspora valbyensis NRRL Y-1626]